MSPTWETTKCPWSSYVEYKSIYRDNSDEHKRIPPAVGAKGARGRDWRPREPHKYMHAHAYTDRLGHFKTD